MTSMVQGLTNMLDDHRDFARSYKWRRMNGLEDRKHSSGAGRVTRYSCGAAANRETFAPTRVGPNS